MKTTAALIAYLEGLTVTQGAGVGLPLRLFPWERRFIRGAFGPGIAEAAITVARGNGKTTLLAGCACAALDGPLREPHGQVSIVAASFDQGRILGEHVKAFMADKLDDRKTWRVWDTAQQFRIEHLPTGARVSIIGSDPRRAHGRTGSFWCDEPAQWPPATGERMRAALATALGKTPGRLIALGTRPADAEHWFAKMLDGATDYAQVHAAGPNDPPFRVRTWRKANPSLRYMPALEATIRREAKRARSDPALMPSFRALRLNQGVADVEESLLLNAETWERIEGTADREGPFALGLDLGGEAAGSAAAAFWPETGRVETFGVFSSIPSLADRGIRDGVGSRYVDMARREELLTAGEYTADVGAMLREVLDRWGSPDVIAADRYRIRELRGSLADAGFPVSELVIRGMGWRDGAEDCRVFRRAALDGSIRPVPSLLLRSAMSEARVLIDPAGNAKLAKASQGGRRLRARDDAAAATILAVAEGTRRAAAARRRRPAVKYHGLV